MADLGTLILAAPLALLLLPLPLLARRLLPPQPAQLAAMRLPGAIGAAALPANAQRRTLTRTRALKALLWCALVLALSGPARLVATADTSASGRDILLSLDLSGSMAIEDFDLDGQRISRLEAVKQVAQGFVASRAGDRIGLVLFADRAYVAAPLTHDLAAVSRAIEEAGIGITGRSTAIAEGLGLALKRVVAGAAQGQVIVLLSDGKETGARMDARQVAALAAERGVRVHTIALGPDDLETRPASRDAVDIALLREIAAASGGTSYRVRDMADLAAMAADLDRLEPNPSRRPPVLVPQPLWIWPAMLALLAALGLGLDPRGAA